VASEATKAGRGIKVMAEQILGSDKKVNEKQLARDIIAGISLGTGIPIAPLGKPIGHLIDVKNRKEKLSLKGFTSGKPQKDKR